jgi:hypothetical protein
LSCWCSWSSFPPQSAPPAGFQRSRAGLRVWPAEGRKEREADGIHAFGDGRM